MARVPAAVTTATSAVTASLSAVITALTRTRRPRPHPHLRRRLRLELPPLSPLPPVTEELVQAAEPVHRALGLMAVVLLGAWLGLLIVAMCACRSAPWTPR